MNSSQNKPVFGIYIHIPYCLQRCTYCDFATYVYKDILPPDRYVALVKSEISQRWKIFNPQQQDVELSTIYFGGGTPSLIPAELIVDLLSELAKFGFKTGPNTEVTIEINPATVDPAKLKTYLAAGVNRFSVGAQTFSDKHLKAVHREHNATQTMQTLELLRSENLNFSFDLLFALPNQSLDELKFDVDKSVEMGSSHISPYCLTVPEGHPLSKNRPLEDDQVEMFSIIHNKLNERGFKRYEISNYARPGFESKHNLLYWTDENYWGLGLSAHSYQRSSSTAPWGRRFWNASNINIYEKDIQAGQRFENQNFGEGFTSEDQCEVLTLNQSLTDFCHTSLRLESGLRFEKITEKFGISAMEKCLAVADSIEKHGLIKRYDQKVCLTDHGILISNQVFEKFTFLD